MYSDLNNICCTADKYYLSQNYIKLLGEQKWHEIYTMKTLEIGRGLLASLIMHSWLKYRPRYSKFIIAYRFRSIPLPFISRWPRKDFYVLLDPSLGCSLSAAPITPHSKRHSRGKSLLDPTWFRSRVGHALIKYSVMRFRVRSILVIKGLKQQHTLKGQPLNEFQLQNC